MAEAILMCLIWRNKTFYLKVSLICIYLITSVDQVFLCFGLLIIFLNG